MLFNSISWNPYTWILVNETFVSYLMLVLGLFHFPPLFFISFHLPSRIGDKKARVLPLLEPIGSSNHESRSISERLPKSNPVPSHFSLSALNPHNGLAWESVFPPESLNIEIFPDFLHVSLILLISTSEPKFKQNPFCF